jgi:hypothetical protein
VAEEARLADTGTGLVPQSDGWFVLNVRDAAWMRHDVFGARCGFEADGRIIKGRPELEVTCGRAAGGRPHGAALSARTEARRPRVR